MRNDESALVTLTRDGNIGEIDYPSGRRVLHSRDAAGRISGVTTYRNSAAAAQPIAWNVQWNPYGSLASPTFRNNLTMTFTTDTDYRIARVQTGWSGNAGGMPGPMTPMATASRKRATASPRPTPIPPAPTASPRSL